MTTASTHVLDAARGLPAAGLAASLTGPLPGPRLPSAEHDVSVGPGGSIDADVVLGGANAGLRAAVTDDDGRIDWGELPGQGSYVLKLATGDWFAAQERETFYPRVVLEVALGAAHTHVALLLSPFAYTTYRGS
ncbi:hydroxyisourate hydrolase [Myceligenerans pegani]|uniref:Hydroxyisourate hydrolase n=1 Tax=Myceligenerans pegani TaxID=2776917 RepID=A0ABR9N2C8_9MICO|nr:hydroxyisourate hydrolase [Myceligenerans sp. TRM 65318]MBE1877801.1 hydroxyisourate hydrolase [Myceligenerans sp. TRM 65318]MBE3020072.1 hydroxyisourate hydrolase [Myceligenerans sp. TRM 65318]